MGMFTSSLFVQTSPLATGLVLETCVDEELGAESQPKPRPVVREYARDEGAVAAWNATLELRSERSARAERTYLLVSGFGVVLLLFSWFKPVLAVGGLAVMVVAWLVNIMRARLEGRRIEPGCPSSRLSEPWSEVVRAPRRSSYVVCGVARSLDGSSLLIDDVWTETRRVTRVHAFSVIDDAGETCAIVRCLTAPFFDAGSRSSWKRADRAWRASVHDGDRVQIEADRGASITGRTVTLRPAVHFPLPAAGRVNFATDHTGPIVVRKIGPSRDAPYR